MPGAARSGTGARTAGLPEWLASRRVRDEDRSWHYVAIFSDISEQHRSRQEIEYLAHHDALTDLPNRLLFNARLDHAISQARRSKRQLAVLFVDLDRFKTINDSPRSCTGVTRSCAGSPSACAWRCVAKTPWPGWAVTSSSSCWRTSPGGACMRLRKSSPRALRQAAAAERRAGLHQPEHRHQPVSARRRGMSTPWSGTPMPRCTRRNRAGAITSSLHPGTHRRGAEQAFLQNHLRRAIEQQEFRLFYQPQVDIETGAGHRGRRCCAGTPSEG